MDDSPVPKNILLIEHVYKVLLSSLRYFKILYVGKTELPVKLLC